MTKAILNGQVIDKKDAVVSIADKGYFFDFSVYSSLKVVQGKLFFPDYHAARLLESAALLGIEHKFIESKIVDWLKSLVEVNKLENSFVRMVLIGDPDGTDAKLFISEVGSLTFYPDKFYSKGVKVITYGGERHVPNAKSKDLMMSFLAYRAAKQQDALDALLVDNDGNIREGTRTNFYAIKDRQLITPPEDKVLAGIAQKIILDVAKEEFEIVRADIQLKDLGRYDEFFMSNTSMNVMPIRQIDDTVFGTTFEKTKIIQKLFKDFYHKQILET